jgi:glucan-binding YG repeat protein
LLLLIDNLKRKSSAEHEKILIELNSKLDFLVKIFKEANENEQETDHIDKKFEEIMTRLDELDKKSEQRHKEVLDKIAKMTVYSNKEIKKASELKSTSREPTPLSNNTSTLESNTQLEGTNTTPTTEPPMPDFKVDPQKPIQNQQTLSPPKNENPDNTTNVSSSGVVEAKPLSEKDSKLLDKLDVGKKKKWF